MVDTIIAETKPKLVTNLDAIDTATARLTQGLAVLGVLESIALQAQEHSNDLELSAEQVAQSLWAARELLEQAQDAVRNITATRVAA